MRRPGVVWAAILGGSLGYDLLCDRRKDDSTLSCATRRLVAAAPGGRVAFTVALIGAGVWFWDHILSPLSDIMEQTSDPREAATSGGLTTT